MSYAKVIQLLQEEGWDTSELLEEGNLVILPVEGEYVYLAEDLRFAGAVWDETRGEWVVQKV